MKKVVFAAGLLTVLNAGSSVEVTPYIVNGDDISATKYPSFVSLFYDRFDYDRLHGVGPYCGATLLADQYVLTAAHCIYGDQDAQLFTSAVPQLQNESDFPYSVLQRVMVEEYYYPDTYDDTTLQDDIAILKLTSPITAVSSYATFVDLANIGDYRKTTEAFYAVGHGNTRSNVDDSDTLQDTQLSFVPNNKCDGTYRNTDTSDNLCMTGAATLVYDNATCQGDSGGPLYWQGRQVGITSFGPTTCGDPGVEPNSVFTEVARYHDWIQSVLAGTELPKVVVNDQQRADFLASGGASTQSTTSDSSNESSSGGGGGGSLGALSMLVLALLGFRRKLHS